MTGLNLQANLDNNKDEIYNAVMQKFEEREKELIAENFLLKSSLQTIYIKLINGKFIFVINAKTNNKKL